MNWSLGAGRTPRAPTHCKIKWDPGEENTHGDAGIARIFVNGVENNQSRCYGENTGGPGMPRDAKPGPHRSLLVKGTAVTAAKDEEARGRETEKEPIHHDDVAQDLLVCSEKDHYDRDASLQNDRC